MHSRFEYEGIVWIDLESPTHEEITSIVEEFDILPTVAEELLLPSTKPRAEFYDSYAYLVLHFPALRHSHKTKEQEIDFIIGTRFLITTHYDVIDPLHKFAKVFEVHSIVDKTRFDHAGFIFFAMLKKLYRAVEHEVEYVRHDLLMIEEDVFSEHQLEMVTAISRSARDVLNLRQVVEPHREVLHALECEGPKIFGEDFAVQLRALSHEYYRVHNHIMRETESLHELRETNNSLLTTRQNETMRVFTILAFITFPLSLITAIFNMQSNPLRGVAHDFWIVMGIMIAAIVVMLWYFKHKKWM